MKDYISYELAVKLKEKGFKEECLCHYIGEDLYYNIESPIANKQLWFSHNKYDNIWHRENYDAPTISQVLKWLMKEKAIHIEVTLWDKGWYCKVWAYEYYEEDNEYSVKQEYQSKDFSSYEDAALAGIEYVLNNLI